MKAYRTRTLIIITLAAALGACGGGRYGMTPATPNSPQPPPEQDLVREGPKVDAHIASVIHSELLFDDRMTNNSLQVAVDEGIVTLRGTVDKLLAKRRATAIAQSIKGVRAVLNHIDVDAPAIEDEALKNLVGAALALDPVVDSKTVTVTAHDGTVTLTGMANSFSESKSAERAAMSVLGVTDVNNEMLVRYTTTRPDHEISKDVAARLAWDVRVDELHVGVSVEDATVVLRGSVGSLQEKEQAVHDSWVSGVSRVDASALKVDPDLSRNHLRKRHAAKTDAEIREAIFDAAALDPRIPRAALEKITVQMGHVTLVGSVSSLDVSLAAEQVARSTVGVRTVDNNLTIERASGRTDAAISQGIREALAIDAYTHDVPIIVETTDAIVKLTGSVRTPIQRARAELAAARIPGVQRVINQLTVRDGDIGHVYWHWTLHDRPLRPIWHGDGPPQTSDEALAKAVRMQLVWEPFAAAWQIEVSAEDGVVTLEGDVDSLHAVYVAEANAYQAGARRVENRLNVRSGR